LSSRRRVKTWYKIVASDIFEGEELGETPADSDEKVVGRTIEVTLRDITGNFDHENYKLWFKIHKVEDKTAYGHFIRERISRDYLRSLVRKRTSRIDAWVESKTKDGKTIRYFSVIITAVRVGTNVAKQIRKACMNYLSEIIPELTLKEVVRSSILDDPINLREEIKLRVKKYAPISHVEPLKIELMSE